MHGHASIMRSLAPSSFCVIVLYTYVNCILFSDNYHAYYSEPVQTIKVIRGLSLSRARLCVCLLYVRRI